MSPHGRIGAGPITLMFLGLAHPCPVSRVSLTVLPRQGAYLSLVLHTVRGRVVSLNHCRWQGARGRAYFPSPCHMIDKGVGTSSPTLKSSLRLQPERGVSNSMNSYHLSLLVATGAINSNTDPGCSRAMGVHDPWQQLRPRYHCRLGWQVGHRPQSSLPTPLRICLSHRT